MPGLGGGHRAPPTSWRIAFSHNKTPPVSRRCLRHCSSSAIKQVVKITTCSWWSSSCAALSCHQTPSPLACGTWPPCLPSRCWGPSAAAYGQTWAAPACPPRGRMDCGWARPGPRRAPLHRNPSPPAWPTAWVKQEPPSIDLVQSSSAGERN